MEKIKAIIDEYGDTHCIFKQDGEYIAIVDGSENIIVKKAFEDIKDGDTLYRIEEGVYYDADEMFIINYAGDAEMYTASFEYVYHRDVDEVLLVFTDLDDNGTIICDINK